MTVDSHDLVLPLALGAAGGLLLWRLMRRQTAATPPREPVRPRPEGTKRPTGAGWQWPIPMWGDYGPVISDGWGSPRTNLDGTERIHYGVDLMYPRRSVRDKATECPAGTPGGSAWHFMPLGVPALAAAAGIVVYAQKTARGHTVQIHHPGNWSTFYQHLADLKVREGEPVRLGQVLGDVGGDPTQRNPLRHLHFELWRGRTQRPGAIDPKPSLLTWQRTRLFPLPDGTHFAETLPPPRHA
jgi:murein DD-endopeptidase MepM/ murein hydrolase activator NlpD